MATRRRGLSTWLAMVALGAAVALTAPQARGQSGTPVHVKAPGRWVLIKAGSFTMGSPVHEKGARGDDEDQHHVTITRDYILQATEVTQAQWRGVFGNNPAFFYGCPECPVERVNWYEATAYCNALSKREGLAQCYRHDGCTGRPGRGMECSSVSFEGLDCRGYRLPTEAEWEYAVRAGTTGARYGELDRIAWYLKNSDHTTHPVGQKQPNRWGLFDMFGNTREWCNDWYGDYPPGPARDPLGPTKGERRIRRGGTWIYASGFLRAGDRNGCTPRFRRASIGFRPARSWL